MKVLHKGVTQGEKKDGLREESEVPALPTNLTRVGAIYKFRARILTDLLRFYHPKREVIESLRTKSLGEARRLRPVVQLKYQQNWANWGSALSENFTDLTLKEVGAAYVVAMLASGDCPSVSRLQPQPGVAVASR